VIDAVNRLIAERQAMDRGFSVAATLSFFGHLTLAIGAITLPVLLPREPLLKVGTVFAVPLPRGGGGVPAAETSAPAPEPVAPKAEAPVEKPAPKIQKPPKEETRKGLPDPNAKKTPGRKEPEPARASGASSGTGTTSVTPGLALGPVGPGVPGGTDVSGDWYLAGVQRRIWTVWMSQIKPETPNEAVVAFTILADGSLSDVRLVQSSGISLVDFAAQRAVQSAAPFAPLPRDYGTNRITIQAVFKPLP
jgi:TonB family protein